MGVLFGPFKTRPASPLHVSQSTSPASASLPELPELQGLSEEQREARNPGETGVAPRFGFLYSGIPEIGSCPNPDSSFPTLRAKMKDGV